MRCLSEISIRYPLTETSWDLLETSQKGWLFCFVFKTSQINLKKDCLFRDVSETAQKHLSQVFVIFQKYPTEMILCHFPRVITISVKINMGPLEALKKWNIFLEQCIDINQLCHGYQWADFCVRVLVSQRSSNPNTRCIIYYFKWFFSTDKTIYNLL